MLTASSLEPAVSSPILNVLSAIASDLSEDLRLETLASAHDQSPFVLHRAFVRAVSETPKAYVGRLRLQCAAAALVATDKTVLDIALDHGFASHEVFTRAFRRRFDQTPSAFRDQARRALAHPTEHQTQKQSASVNQVDVVTRAAPCLTLHHFSSPQNPQPVAERTQEMSNNIQIEAMTEQPALAMTRTVAPTAIASTLAQMLPGVFAHAQKTGAAMAGPPFARYLAMTPGTLTLQGGVPLVAPADGEGEIEQATLPGGEVATLIYTGPYDTLGEGHFALEMWAKDQGRTASGGAWEVYLTDPATTPNPADWKTKIYLPLAEKDAS